MSTAPADVARACFEAFARGDAAAFSALLSPGIEAWVTNAEGGVDRVIGRAAYLNRIPDMASAHWRIAVTQVAAVDDERAMTAIEIRAHRNGKELHNFAAFLTRIVDGLIVEMWMVEAEPAYSDEFWS